MTFRRSKIGQLNLEDVGAEKNKRQNFKQDNQNTGWRIPSET